MSASVVVELSVGGDEPADQTRSLLEWLIEVEELRGRVKAVESPPRQGTLGPVLEGLAVALGPGGVATALAASLVSWIRHRSGDVELRVTLRDGASVEVSAKRVRGLDGPTLAAQVEQLTQLLQSDSAGQEDDEERPLRRAPS
jgi:hypothetical protein